MAFTYATLTTTLETYTEDDSPDFTDNLDTIIGLGELKLLRDLDLELFEDTATVATAAGSPTITKPPGYITNRTLDYTGANGRMVYLHPRTVEYCKDYTDAAGNGDPLYYAELNQTQWMISPPPVQEIAVNCRYTRRPDGLSGTTATTWLSTNVPDALLYACLIAAEEYLKSDERLPVWKQKYGEEILPSARHEVSKIVKVDYNQPRPR